MLIKKLMLKVKIKVGVMSHKHILKPIGVASAPKVSHNNPVKQANVGSKAVNCTRMDEVNFTQG
jgi:hypothetical protein